MIGLFIFLFHAYMTAFGYSGIVTDIHYLFGAMTMEVLIESIVIACIGLWRSL